jgi:hypothetical protein
MSGMTCPACRSEVQLAEKVPAALAGAYAYVTCPSAGCARDLVAFFPEDAEKEPRLLAPHVAHEKLRAEANRRSKRELRRIVVIVAAVVGSAAITVGCLACAEHDANPSSIWSSMLVVALITALVLLLVRVGFMVDARLGARRWMTSLPRAHLAFVRMPSTYRA